MTARPLTTMRRVLLAASLLSIAPHARAQGAGAQGDSARAMGRRYTEWLWAGRLPELYARFSPEMRQTLDSAKLAAFHQRVIDQLGSESAVLSEEESAHPPYTFYDRKIAVEKIAQVVVVRWGVDSAGTIGLLLVALDQTAEAPTAFLDYHTKTSLRLPFAGDWFVVWGGRTLAQNRHASSPDQRFAYDFSAVQGGSTHRGTGAANTDYYCYGRPVLAPGAGTVVDVVDTVAENAPGVMNGDEPLGNHVIIDHGNGEFSFLAHFQRGSIRVKSGEHIARGAVLGLTGNSGNSSEPHLHYHLQSTPSFQVGAGMPAQFEHYVANGTPVARGEPTRLQNIHPGP